MTKSGEIKKTLLEKGGQLGISSLWQFTQNPNILKTIHYNLRGE